MAGVYLHIPYCKQACVYCNFHFSTNSQNKAFLIEAMLIELDHRRDYLNNELVTTIYFGGGTPSLLSIEEINAFLNRIHQTQAVAPDAEITFEVNPDDLSKTYLKELKNSGINRLSIGIQSFFETDMEYMHRAHTAAQSFSAIESCCELDFTNISIDLIYGIPGTSLDHWQTNLEYALGFPIPHLSCYALTVEPRTQLQYQIKAGKATAPDEGHTISQFETLMHRTAQAGFQQYEISNFAKPGFESKHNSSYWQGIPYLGLGPSAHSFNGLQRQWNISNNNRYIDAISKGQTYFELEDLDPAKQYNEFILTRIRTSRGIMIDEIPKGFHSHFNLQVQKQIAGGNVLFNGNAYTLTQNGKYIADRITMELFY